MRHDYADITRLTDKPPEWYDENGVPRYASFHPDRIANVYASEAVLAEIQCQSCGMRFRVAISELNAADRLWNKSRTKRTGFISDLVLDGSLHYGDPPNTGCCVAGASMNSIPIAVLEYWVKPFVKREKGDPIHDPALLHWTRNRRFETPISKVTQSKSGGRD